MRPAPSQTGLKENLSMLIFPSKQKPFPLILHKNHQFIRVFFAVFFHSITEILHFKLFEDILPAG